MKATFQAGLVLWLAVATAAAADWPMSRGNPSLTGVASGYLPSQPALLWSF